MASSDSYLKEELGKVHGSKVAYLPFSLFTNSIKRVLSALSIAYLAVPEKISFLFFRITTS